MRAGADTGIHTSAAKIEGDAPKKSLFPTPITVDDCPFTRSVFPTAEGSEPRCSFQNR